MRNKLFNMFRILAIVLRGRKITILLVVANVFILSLYVTGWSSSKFRSLQPQANKKRVERHFAPKNVPIEIIEPKAKGKAITLGEDFEGESDWLRHLTFKVKNKSNKPITFFHLDLDLPETQATGPVMMHQLFFGQRSDFTATLSNRPLRLEPNGEIEVPLDSEFNSIKKLVEHRQGPVENISKLVIRIGEVMFEDGTLYSGGGIFKPNSDASSPHKWLKVRDFDKP